MDRQEDPTNVLKGMFDLPSYCGTFGSVQSLDDEEEVIKIPFHKTVTQNLQGISLSKSRNFRGWRFSVGFGKASIQSNKLNIKIRIEVGKFSQNFPC